MKKKSSPSKSNKAATPQSAQLEAVRRLSRAGRDHEAQIRAAELRTRYPNFKPLLALSWEVDYNAGDFLSATLHAWDWSKASPSSLPALEALRDSAFPAGFSALGASAIQKLAQIEDKPFPELPPLHGALGDLTFEQAVAVDLSRLFLAHERYDEAIAILEGIDHPSTRNNLALVRFEQGHITAALADFEANWRQDTRNLFALRFVVQLRLWTDGYQAANELADALRATPPLRAEDAYGKIFGLLLLGARDDVIDAWNTERDAEFWTEEKTAEHSRCAYFAGIASLQNGNTEAAAGLFSEALDLDPNNEHADKASTALTFRALGKEADPSAGEFGDWFPQSWITEIRSTKGIQAQNTILDAQQRRCDAHVDYLSTAIELGGQGVRMYAMPILKIRALDGDNAALDALRGLLTRPCGPDQVRMDLDLWLQQQHFAEPGQSQRILLRGEVQEATLHPTRLHAEQHDIGLPPKSQSQLEQMHRLLGKNNLQGALRIAEELAAAHPQIPTLVGNIANIKEALGHDLDEVEAIFQRTAELDPTYLFAQAGLARIAACKGDVERARALLTPLQGREEYHFSEWRALLMVERLIALEQQDMGEVFKLDAALRTIQEQFR